MKKKIILIGPVYPYKGGISHYTGLMYRALAKKYDVEMISYKMQYPKFLFHKEQRDYENDTFQIEDTRYMINTAHVANIIRTARYIKKQEPAMVIIQWWHPYFAPCYYLLAKFMGKQNITYVCHNVFPHERFPMDRKLTRLVMKTGRHYILHAKEEAKELETIIPNADYRVTPHPTYNAFAFRGLTKQEARRDLGIPDKEKVILFFGFVRPYKGLKHMLEAMPEILSSLPESKLMVVGEFAGDKEDYLEQIKRLGIRENIMLRDGYTPDKEVEPYFAACDLVVLPYESATQSGIVQIAYGFEKPVVVTRVGGLPDVVSDGETGYIVEPCKPEELAGAVIRYYQENKEAEWRQNIQREAYRFSWDRMSEVVEGLM